MVETIFSVLQIWIAGPSNICRAFPFPIVLIGDYITSPTSEACRCPPSSCTITQEHSEHHEYTEHMSTVSTAGSRPFPMKRGKLLKICADPHNL